LSKYQSLCCNNDGFAWMNANKFIVAHRC
jgi:hypothetical protein